MFFEITITQKNTSDLSVKTSKLCVIDLNQTKKTSLLELSDTFVVNKAKVRVTKRH